ncbi:MAG: hypothetical protein R3E66_15335 [bacterium]
MKKSTMWLAIFVGAMVLSFGMCVCSLTSGSSAKPARAGDIDLEAVTVAYAAHVQSGSKDLKDFEARINQPNVYAGSGHVSTVIDDRGTVVGYVESNQQPGYQGTDDLVFRLDAEKQTSDLVASDRSSRYYRHHSPGIFETYLMLRMLDNQRGFYGGRYYQAPSTVNYQSRGYFRKRPRTVDTYGSGSSTSSSSSRSTGSRSVRTGSSGTRRSTGGGFGFGK